MNAGQADKRKRKLHQLLVDEIVIEDDLLLTGVDSKMDTYPQNHTTPAIGNRCVPDEITNDTLQYPRNSMDKANKIGYENKENQQNIDISTGKNKHTKRSTLLKRNGQIVKKETIYDTWYVIRPHELPSEPPHQRHYLQLPLVKLANATACMKLPSVHWSSKVTLYKVRPAVLQRHTLTIFTGDLKVHKIPEKDRYKYQPSCVIFRRSAAASAELPVVERCKYHVPFDRVVIFKHKYFNVNIDGKHVNLNGAPEAVTCIQDIQKLLDILDCITLSNSMIEIVPPK